MISISAALFVPAEIALGYMLQINSGDLANIYKFSSVVLSCVFCIFLFRYNKDYFLVQLGLIFTAFADWFLVMEEPLLQLEGMICFSVVQIAYGLMLTTHQKSLKAGACQVFLRLTLSFVAIFLALLVLGDGADDLSLVSMFYYANIIINLVLAFRQIKKSLIFPIAMLLFVICDTFIGLNVLLSDYVSSSDSAVVKFISELDFDIAWAFYLPSQMLIPLSLIEREVREKGKRSIRRAEKKDRNYSYPLVKVTRLI